MKPSNSAKMGAVETSDWIALTALLVSLVTAAWTAYNHFRWARPVMKVSGEQWMQGTSEEPVTTKAGFSIDITNVGDHATQITDAYWQLDRGDGIDSRVAAGAGGGGLDALFVSGPDTGLRPAPEFPFTLDRYQSKGWDFTISIDGWRDLQSIQRVRLVVEYTSRRSREVIHGAWEPSQIGIDARRRAMPGHDV